MAQTKIWKIDHHLGRCIKYIMNPEKTQEGKLVTGVNMFIPPNDWQTPTNQMLSTKLRFGKQGGRLAYHLDQSFKPGEVSPGAAHQIGVELANPYLPPDAIKGGTGYGLFTELAPEIDEMFPDYSIYPECDYAIGYLTRGCVNRCRWCIVPKKEGNIQPYRAWQDLVRQDTDKLVLMDNNILACDYGIEQLAGLIGSGYKIDLNQGMDARLVTPEVADVLARLKWISYLRFSCDQESQIEPILRTCALLKERGVRPYRMFVYLLVTSDLDNVSRRVDALKGLRGINLYAQAERNESLGIRPNKAQLEFAQRYVYSGCFRRETWEEYIQRKGLVF